MIEENTDVAALAARLTCLETQNRQLAQRVAAHARRVRAACVFAGVLLLAGLLMGQAQPDRPAPQRLIEAETIVAERLFIADRDGMKRGVFTILPDGRAALLLSEANPKPKAAAGLTVGMDGSSSLVLADRAGNVRIDLNLESDGVPHVSLNDRTERERVSLYMLPDGSPQLDLLDEQANKRVRMAVETDGWSRMQLLDDADKPRLTLMARTADASGLFLMDKDVIPRICMVSKGEPRPGAPLDPLTGAATSGDPILTLSDPAMKTIWSVP